MKQETDIQVGDYVTILQWYLPHPDRSWCGDVLKVNAIDWPFYAVEEVKGFKMKVSLDARVVDLKKLSHDFVQSLERKEN